MKQDRVILAGDVGGTNTRLAIVHTDLPTTQLGASQSYPSANFQSFEDIVDTFVLSHVDSSIQSACFGVAGPVQNGYCKPTNLNWALDARSIENRFKIDTVAVINDLVANAYGIACLRAGDFVSINLGLETAGNAAVISPGTGLGEAGLYWDGAKHCPFASEGGHAEFGPRNELEIELVNYLEAQLDRVSYESVLSGPGLVNIYNFLRDTHYNDHCETLENEMRQSDPAACISRAALSGTSAICDQALEMFLEIYGAEAGNLALKMMATGGVWLGGGIVAKLADRLQESPAFMSGFTNKGKLSHLVEKIPVRAILNDKTALLGAAQYAANAVS